MSAEITLREVFDAVQDIRSTLAGMQGHGKTIEDHETRIRTLEKNQWRWAGAASAVGALLGFFGDKLIG